VVHTRHHQHPLLATLMEHWDYLMQAMSPQRKSAIDLNADKTILTS